MDNVTQPPDAPAKKRFKFKVPKTLADLQHKGEHFFHMSYLGAVGWEAHGLYQIMAIICFGVTFIGTFIASEGH